MRTSILWGVAGLAAATIVACAEGDELSPDESDVISHPDASADGAASSSGKSSSSGAVASSSGEASSSGAPSSSSGDVLDAGNDDAAALDASTDAGGSSSSSSSSSSGAVPPAPAAPILHSIACDVTEIDSLEGPLRVTLTFSDVNADYKELELKLVYPDGDTETKAPITIPAGYDGNPGPVSILVPITLRVGYEGAYQLLFRVKDDTNKFSNELRVIIYAND